MSRPTSFRLEELNALAHYLARHLHHWATRNPYPYPGPHWP